MEMVEKKRHKLQKKSTGKVLVEEDFVEKTAIRDPSIRSKSKRDDSNEAKTNRTKLSEKKLSSHLSIGKPPQTAPELMIREQRSNISQ